MSGLAGLPSPKLGMRLSPATVATPAIESFGMNLLAGRHLILAGSRHEILQEQDRYRGQFWAAFDAFVPGTPRF